MDWTKIKTKHFLFNKHWTDRMTAGFVRLLCLTAHLERLPDNDEVGQVIGPKSLESLSKVLQKSGKSLSEVLQKVLEDVDRVDKKRNRDREYHKTYDKSRQRGQDANSLPREDKIREDKRRKEYSNKRPSARLPDEDFLKALKANPAYTGINIDRELSKMDAWFLTPRGSKRTKTRQFIVNWLNKADGAVGGNGETPRERVKRIRAEAEQRG